MVSRHKPRATFNKLRVDPIEFEEQIKWLHESGWKFLFMSQLQHSIPRQSVVITFDDGYRDNLLLADPILKKYNARATVYLVVDRHERDWSTAKKSHHAGGELMQEPKLLDQDVDAMLNSGRWEIGAHSITHPNLMAVNAARRRDEILGSKQELENRFRVEVDSFAYPFGMFTQEDVDCAEISGYRTAVTTCQGISEDLKAERLQLRRVKISGQDGLMNFKLRMRTGKCRMRD